mmetsp:Transcript_2530/g.4247  ORF Transcript_2530/g.4247 Transcript_2530/m.4247 type:complete len:199 (+) Transcript_2530:367-963(+)
MTGVSIGAINVATLASFQNGEEEAAIEALDSHWFNLKTNQIFREWEVWGPIAGFWRHSFFDSTPIHRGLNDSVKNPFRKRVAFQSVNINDGRVLSFDETMDPQLLIESVASSASIPVAFYPTATIDDLELVDGTTYSSVNPEDAVEKCRELVADDKDIVLDIVMCEKNPLEIDEMRWYSHFKPFHYFKRKQHIKDFYQ